MNELTQSEGNGASPCLNCSRNGYECRFPPTSAKMVVEENWVERLQGRCKALEYALAEAVPDADKRQEIAAQFGLKLRTIAASSDGSDSPPAASTAGPPSRSGSRRERMVQVASGGEGYHSKHTPDTRSKGEEL